MEHVLRIFDFNVYNKTPINNDSDDSDDSDDSVKYKKYVPKIDSSEFIVQMFGINAKGEKYSVIVEDFKPYFYIKVGDDWSDKTMRSFIKYILSKMKPYYKDCIIRSEIIKKKKLYGFDGGKYYNFIKLDFNNTTAMNQVKNLWFTSYEEGHTLLKDRETQETGLMYNKTLTEIYEANIPPLLRLFHIKQLSPSGWIAIPKQKTIMKRNNKETTCDYELEVSYKHIYPAINKETLVPYKICSFDIEASSSHGDFPIPVKNYKKLAVEIMQKFESSQVSDKTREIHNDILKNIIRTAFGYETESNISLIYAKQKLTETEVNKKIEKVLKLKISDIVMDQFDKEAMTIDLLFNKFIENENSDEVENEFAFYNNKKGKKEGSNKNANILDVILNSKIERETKIMEITRIVGTIFPKVHGDMVTCIGSTFMNYGETNPHKNHIIVLNGCDPIEDERCETEIESYDTEREVLLAWQQMIQREDPDIIIGYNIFGFDYEFMFRRARETNCVEEFLQLSRNVDEICGKYDENECTYDIETSSISIASGQHDLRYIKMKGRLQVDLYNYYRREVNLSSYKLDCVAGHFIGDCIKEITYDSDNNSVIHSHNLTGLIVGSYIHIEEIGHSVDYYANGSKFLVEAVNNEADTFTVHGKINPDMSKRVRWCSAKDDVSPKDLFRLANGTNNDRSIMSKYCIQDCNLVQYLFMKSDILTGYIEMSSICSVPMDFLVMRGQGIKLTSFIAKKCREKDTLMPVIDKGPENDCYEGAIVLEPKEDLYLDNPVACVDFASLYPSSIISENLSHDSKVWTKEYDLEGVLIKETGTKNEAGEYIYDNLRDYEYVDVQYDTHKYVKKTPSAKSVKTICGYKQCRFVQFQEGHAIFPSISKELLQARKNTKKLMLKEADPFFVNVLDQRQKGYKLTGNSLYGYSAAKTSTVYEKDVAACTTSIGRNLLTYAKRVIEESYKNQICETKTYGKVITNAEYIYGDTDSVFFTFNLQTIEGEKIRGKKALEITIELAQQAGKLASQFLKGPHDLEYEKTFMPFCLLSKKRYVGMKYELDPNKCKRDQMGIVLKRRDNAPIVKDIYGGVIDILMKEQDINKSIAFLRESLDKIVHEQVSIDKLIITKSLGSHYKNPKAIAHKVLADRIGEREPGNKPASGDRIPYIFIHTNSNSRLQGDKIETPSFIADNKLKINYSFYITNQIMKPLIQVYALVYEKILELQNKKPKLKYFQNQVKLLKFKHSSDETYKVKLDKLRNGEVKKMLFDPYLRTTNNKKEGNQSILSFFERK